MSAEDLKKKLRDAAQQGGKLAINSGMLQAGNSEVAEKRMPTNGPVEAAIPNAALQDPLVNAGTASGGEGLSQAAEEQAGNPANDPVAAEFFSTEKVTLTEGERNAFLEALVSGKRYEHKFVIFDGKIRGKIRCRSTEESEAVAAWLNGGIQDGRYKIALDYSLDIRNILLTAQVAELNGIRYNEMAKPLFRTQSGETVQPPGWLKDVSTWTKQPEPVIAAVYEELRLFEKKYWTMVGHARDQNFWQPVGSILV